MNAAQFIAGLEEVYSPYKPKVRRDLVVREIRKLAPPALDHLFDMVTRKYSTRAYGGKAPDPPDRAEIAAVVDEYDRMHWARPLGAKEQKMLPPPSADERAEAGELMRQFMVELTRLVEAKKLKEEPKKGRKGKANGGA